MNDEIRRMLAGAPEPDHVAAGLVRARAEQVLRPLGALARLDDVAVSLAGWQRTASPGVRRPRVIVFVVGSVIGLILGGGGRGLGLLPALAYFTYFEGTSSGQTVGKRAMNIRVVDFNTGTTIGHGRAAIRWVFRLVSFFVCLLGYLWMLWDKEKQTWHDKVSGAVVVPTDAYPVEVWPG